MKKKTTAKPTASKFSLLRQVCNFIPPHLVPRLARETGVAEQARTFSPWSHVVSLLYAQIIHSLGLNDVGDALRLHSGPLSAVRGATPPPKNTLSHAIWSDSVLGTLGSYAYSSARNFGSILISEANSSGGAVSGLTFTQVLPPTLQNSQNGGKLDFQWSSLAG